jgi:tetratricopeptide (TPR) repeat protein/predicted Ser/Thr protein kinase
VKLADAVFGADTPTMAPPSVADAPTMAPPSVADAPTMAAATGGLDDADATMAAGAAPAPRGAVDEPRRGEEIGRYVVLTPLGAGGMGVVVAAYDPELDRKVALKLLRDPRGGADARARLLREAQALAQLAHPNVVAVHDVGTVDERVYVAMEFIAGETLQGWLDRAPRGWREVLRMALAAGDGLAAAHAAGLVHRDFKADNVMVGDDGRVRVMDFGLARATLSGEATPVGAAQVPGGALGTALTRIGALMGTPRTMAPEQWEGRETDARTDQFAFCVTLWEALHGAPPFAGDTLYALCHAVTHGERRPPPPGSRAPAWLRHALDRGLSLAPDERWPTMAALLAALRDDPTRRRRWALAGASVALIAALGFAGWRVDRGQRIAACEATATTIDEVWNPAARTSIMVGMKATGAAFAERSAEVTTARLDTLARGWSTARRDGCIAATVDQTLSAELVQRSEACLDELQAEIGALAEVLQRPDRQLVTISAEATANLREPATCLDPTRLGAPEAMSAAEREASRAIRRNFARIASLIVAADYEAAQRLLDEARARADALGLPSLRARARALAGRLLSDRGDFAGSRAADEEAYLIAGRGRADELAADLATALAITIGIRLARHDEGLMWSRIGEMWLDRLEVPDDDRRRSDVRLYRGLIAQSRGDLSLAEEELRAAQALRARLGDDQDIAAASNLEALAIVASDRGDYERAVLEGRRVLALREALLGPAHPHVASTRNNLAQSLLGLGALDEAEVELRRALAIREAALGPAHPSVGDSLTNLANLLADRRLDFPAAIAANRRALTIAEATYGPDHPNTATIHNNLGRVLMRAGELDDGELHLRRALELTEATFGADHHEVAFGLTGLGEIALLRGDFLGAQALHRRALAVREAGLGRDHPYVVYSLAGLGEALARAGAAEALPILERALALGPRTGDPELLARIRVALADALTAAGRDLERAATLRAEAQQPARP